MSFLQNPLWTCSQFLPKCGLNAKEVWDTIRYSCQTKSRAWINLQACSLGVAIIQLHTGTPVHAPPGKVVSQPRTLIRINAFPPCVLTVYPRLSPSGFCISELQSPMSIISALFFPIFIEVFQYEALRGARAEPISKQAWAGCALWRFQYRACSGRALTINFTRVPEYFDKKEGYENSKTRFEVIRLQ